MKNQEKFVFLLEWQEPVQHLTNEEKGILFQNFINYASALPLDESNRQVNIAWGYMKPNIDRMNSNYSKSIENGKKGGAPKGTEPWNKGKGKTASNANQEQTNSEPDANHEQTYKYKYKDNVITSEEVITNNVDLGGYGNFLKKFPPAKQRDIDDGKKIWDSFQQEEKAEVIRHVSSYIKKMIADGQEQYIKNSFAYLESELWLDMKPRSFVAKPIERGMRNMSFIKFYSKLKSISEDDATAFLYRTSTDKEFSQAMKLYQAEKDKLFQIKN